MRKRKKLLGAAWGVLLAVLVFAAGPAGAVYVGDGSKPNDTTGGWDITDYGKCFAGIKSDGTIVLDTAHDDSRPDCIDHVYTSPTAADYNATNCLKTTGRVGVVDDVSHYWASTCVDGSGNGIGLSGLDRTSTNCALKGGTWQLACTNAWVYTGPANDGAPGFCYTKIDLTSYYGTALADCPTTLVGFKWLGNKCSYDYGTKGFAFAQIKKKDGSTYVAAGGGVNFTDVTDQGDCLWYGGSWSTGVTKSGTDATVATPGYDSKLAIVESSRAGCLECHNSVSQNNGYAERWKETYLETGHKNMLRKVVPGRNLAGPDGAIYTEDASGNALDFTAGTVSVGGIDKDLYYLFGDWMAPAPNSVFDNGGGAMWTDTSTPSSNGYSCAACHTTGWMNPDTAKGVCYPDSTKTSKAACEGAGSTWVASSGKQGTAYTPAEPAAFLPAGYSGITGKWDRDGIMCSRCHEAVFVKTGPSVMATSGSSAGTYSASGPAGTSTHNQTAGNGNSEANNNVCFGCHQSLAKTYVGGTFGDYTYPVSSSGVTILDPTMIPTGTSHGTAWGREFNGHVLGNMFLNSPHARFTGSVVPNALGKYDLKDNLATQYASTFKGMVCKSSTTYGSGSALEMVWKDSANHEIENRADCNLANGKAAGDDGDYGYWQAESTGNCTTCHDVHQSLFVEGAEAIKRECTTCHIDTEDQGYAAAGAPQVAIAMINHPGGPGTPLANEATEPYESCEICHMPKPTDEGFPMHLWRVNIDPTYDTFPTEAQFNGTGVDKDRRARTAPDGTYTQAVWVDLDLTCGQCHGGGTSKSLTPAKAGLPYFTKADLAMYAVGMHNGVVDLTPNYPVSFTVVKSGGGLTVTLTPTVSCMTNCQAFTYEVNWGDGTTNNLLTHTYAGAGTKTIGLTAFGVYGGDTKSVGSKSQNVILVVTDVAPVASGTPNFTANTWAMTVTDTSTDENLGTLQVIVDWGDGTTKSTGVSHQVFAHTYAKAGTFNVTLRATDSKKQTHVVTVATVNPQYFTIGGTVKKGSSFLSGATVKVYRGSTLIKSILTPTGGAFSTGATLKPGVYTLKVTKSKYTFPSFPTVTVGPSDTNKVLSAN